MRQRATTSTYASLLLLASVPLATVRRPSVTVTARVRSKTWFVAVGVLRAAADVDDLDRFTG
jgi:hypothetical protein